MNAIFTRVVSGFACAVASGLLVAAIDPANAAAPRPVDGAAVTERVAAARPETVKYCIIDLSIGNRIPQRMCKTKAQWAQQGIRVNVQ